MGSIFCVGKGLTLETFQRPSAGRWKRPRRATSDDRQVEVAGRTRMTPATAPAASDVATQPDHGCSIRKESYFFSLSGG